MFRFLFYDCEIKPRRNGLAADGAVGKETWEKMF